jgi:hypothetical protein
LIHIDPTTPHSGNILASPVHSSGQLLVINTSSLTDSTTITTKMLSSHGRGGAGNMADSATTEKTDPSKFQTPVLKGSVVTTGRGGTGNMAKNDDPRETRKRQDVEAYVLPPSSVFLGRLT